jgi:hypothetical protein
MRAEGFSFPCPTTERLSAVIEPFFKANPQSVYNPFPLLARRRNFRQARTQPLTRIYYWPTVNDDFEEAYEVVEFLHEHGGHIKYHDSPAKALARYHQAARFLRLDKILRAEKWDSDVEKSWNSLCKISKQLSAIANHILLSEELLATAACFEIFGRAVNTFSDYAPWRRDLEKLEDATVAYYEGKEVCQLFPDFRILYFGTIKKVITWASLDDPTVLDKLVSTFLQAIHISEDSGSWAMDSHQQCLLLAEQVKRMDNPVQLSDWLSELIVQEDYFLSGITYLKKLADEGRGTVAEDLWRIAYGTTTPNGLINPMPKKITLENLPCNDRLSIVLTPTLHDKQWYINIGQINKLEGASHYNYIESEPVQVVLKLEALLEQLEGRDGICCPYYRYKRNMPEACMCHPGWKKSLLRILQWAREGKFGPGGTWRDLPPECSSRI